MFNLPDLNVTGFESKAYIRYYITFLFVTFVHQLKQHHTSLSSVGDQSAHYVAGACTEHTGATAFSGC